MKEEEETAFNAGFVFCLFICVMTIFVLTTCSEEMCASKYNVYKCRLDLKFIPVSK